jgi:alginate O-acetyltransferase complex protein AlgI
VQKSILLIASYIFYAAWNPPFVILLWLSTLVDWYVAKALADEDVQVKRRLLLTVSLAVNLGLLGFFNTENFFLKILLSWQALQGFLTRQLN